MRAICICLLILCTFNAIAQKEKRKQYAAPQLVVNFHPLALLNPDQRLMFGAERRLNSRLSVLGDVGVIVRSGYLDEAHSANGFELRPAIRYYYSRKNTGFVQGQIHYRLANYKLHDWLGYDCVNGVPAYEKLQQFSFQKSQVGAAIVTGGTERLGRHWQIDVSVGLGLVYRTQKVTGETQCCYFPEGNFFGNTQQPNAWIPVVPVAVKLGYVIK